MSSNRNLYANWNQAHDRLTPEAWPALTPSFSVPAGATIFTFGSCFARNIEKHLVTLGFDVPTARASMPAEEWSQPDNFFLNRYTPAAILADIEGADRHLSHPEGYDAAYVEEQLLPVEDGLVIDVMFPAFVPVTPERAHERRRELNALTAQAFQADCVSLTLGLIEVFRDIETGHFICAAPSGKLRRAFPDRFAFKRLTFLESYQMVQKAIEILRRRNPVQKILITTSPIAMTRTFSQDDVIVANTYSKSQLRTVCGQIAEETDQLDYFPSYENATVTRSWEIYDPDMLHLGKDFIGKIVDRLSSYYFTDVPNVNVLLQKSLRNYIARDAEAACADVAKALELDPDNLTVLAQASQAFRLNRDTDKVIEIDRRIAELAPSAQHLENLARSLLRKGAHEEALEVAEQALELTPGHAARRMLKARLLHLQQRPDESIALLEQVVIETPAAHKAIAQLFDVLKDKGDHARIIDLAERHISHIRGVHKDRIRAELAWAHLRLGNRDEALRYHQTAQKESKFLRGFEEALQDYEV